LLGSCFVGRLVPVILRIGPDELQHGQRKLVPAKPIGYQASMVDRVSSEVRSAIMRAVKSRHTGPEMIVRRAAHAMGFRFRLHDGKLPGKPDIVLRRHRSAILVHGCFWHGHACAKGRLPKSNRKFWTEKIARNRLRDSQAIAALRRLGWKTLVVWQCQTRDSSMLRRKLERFLGSAGTL
jgi:DNA mismatch endonuclease (patch repair protein)